jgi:hypothetical protein
LSHATQRNAHPRKSYPGKPFACSGEPSALSADDGTGEVGRLTALTPRLASVFWYTTVRLYSDGHHAEMSGHHVPDTVSANLRHPRKAMQNETVSMILEDFATFLAALIAEALEQGLPDEAIAVGLEEAAAAVRGKLP